MPVQAKDDTIQSLHIKATSKNTGRASKVIQLLSILCLMAQTALQIAAAVITDEMRTVKRKGSWKRFPVKTVFLGKEREEKSDFSSHDSGSN